MPKLKRSSTGILLTLLVLVVIAGCAAPVSSPAPSSVGAAQESQPAPRQSRTLTIGMGGQMKSLGIFQIPGYAGGIGSLLDIPSNGLVSTEVSSQRPVGHLAERVPSLEDGSVVLLPDGRMQVTYRLRPEVTWQDGTPFTADDLLFARQVLGESSLPVAAGRTAIRQIDTTEAPDPRTFVVTFKEPFFNGSTLGLRDFWPLPKHLLQDGFDRYQATKDADGFINLPYWTSDYLHLGPYRVTEVTPGQGMTFEAFRKYYRGEPKIDRIVLREFAADGNTLFTGLISGSVDMFMDGALNSELGFLLEKQWKADGGGVVHIGLTDPWLLESQWRSAYQMEPANLDPRQRAALYHAMDRDALAEALFAGHAELAAYSMLAPNDPNYEATRDALRRYSYDPDRSRALLREGGWAPGPDGVQRNALDGRRYRTALWSSPGRDRDVSAIADYWRRVGLDVEEYTLSAAEFMDTQKRSTYPGWFLTFGWTSKVEGPAASPESRWLGNYSGYDDPRGTQVMNTLRSSITPRDQLQAYKGISDFIANELVVLMTWYAPLHAGARKGVKAFDDFEGGGRGLGMYSRNAHLWEIP